MARNDPSWNSLVFLPIFTMDSKNNEMKEISELKEIASQVRRDIVRMVHGAQSGHPGGSLGCVEVFTALYFRVLNHDPKFNMAGSGEDMFFLSNGHISPVWYSVLARSGYFEVSELNTFRTIDSRLQGHPATEEGLPGIRVASGSLGQGISVAVGAAEAKKLDGDDGLVYVHAGDGELQEGQVWEAFMYAPHRALDNLTVIVDWNGQQIDGPNNAVLGLGDLPGKFRAFGWNVVHMNGNDMEDVVTTLENLKQSRPEGIPTVVLMKTEMGYGVDFMEGTHEWHGKAPNDEQAERALSQLKETLGDY